MPRKKSRLLKSKAQVFRRNNAKEYYKYSAFCVSLASAINRTGATEIEVRRPKNIKFYGEAIN